MKRGEVMEVYLLADGLPESDAELPSGENLKPVEVRFSSVRDIHASVVTYGNCVVVPS